MARVVPGSTAKSPAALADMPIRGGKNLTPDVANWVESAHNINKAMALEMHGAAHQIRRRIKKSGGPLGSITRSMAARRATRPLLRAAARANGAANGCYRFWRVYKQVTDELRAASKRTPGSTR